MAIRYFSNMKILMAFVLVLTVGTAFSQNSEWTNIDRKAEIKWISKNEIRKKPTIGEYVTLNLSYFTDTDSLLFSSSTTDLGFIRLEMREPEFNGDLMAAIGAMHLLDSVHIRIPSNTFFPKVLKVNRPSDISGKSFVIVRAKLLKIQTDQELAIEMNQQREEAMKAEPAKIDDYIAEHSFNGETLPCGALIQWITHGSGEQPRANEKVKVMYVGTLLNGKEFDKSDVPFQFPVGKEAVIKGWDEALVRMRVGDTVRLLVPSKAAYAARGVPGTVIGPFEPLLFEIKLLEIVR